MPGPQIPVRFVDADVEKFMFFVPPVKTIGHFFCLLSYNGKVSFGIASDSRLVPAPEQIVQNFSKQVEVLTQAIEARAGSKVSAAADNDTTDASSDNAS